MFAVVDKFTEDLRAYYRRIGLAGADDFADAHAEMVRGMYAVSHSQAHLIEHFDGLLAIYRADLPFHVKRERLNAHFNLLKRGKSGARQHHVH